MAPTALRTLAPRLPRMRNLPARHRADVDALAERLVHLEASRALDGVDAVAPRHLARGLVRQPVPRVGTHVDGLADDVVRGLAVLAGAEGVGEGVARLGAEVVGVGPGLRGGLVWGWGGDGGGDVRGRWRVFGPFLWWCFSGVVPPPMLSWDVGREC